MACWDESLLWRRSEVEAVEAELQAAAWMMDSVVVLSCTSLGCWTPWQQGPCPNSANRRGSPTMRPRGHLRVREMGRSEELQGGGMRWDDGMRYDCRLVSWD